MLFADVVDRANGSGCGAFDVFSALFTFRFSDVVWCAHFQTDRSMEYFQFQTNIETILMCAYFSDLFGAIFYPILDFSLLLRSIFQRGP